MIQSSEPAEYTTTGLIVRVVGWAVGFGAILALLAYFAVVGAPLVALAVLGLLALLSLGGLARFERLATADLTDARLCGSYAAAMVVFGLVVAVSVMGKHWYPLGFAAFGLAVHCLVRAVHHLRRWTAGNRKVAASFSVISGVGLLLVPVVWLVTGTFGGLLWAVVFAAVVGGAFAIELWSATFPAILADHPAVAGLVGGAVVAVMTAVLWIASDPVVTTLVVAAVALATAMFITSKDAPVLVVLVLLALVWSTLPRVASYPDGQKEAAGEAYVAVLGDSYMSGEGTTEYFPRSNVVGDGGSECRRSPTSWSMLLNPPETYDAGDELGIPRRVLNLSCSGAVTADIRRGPEPEGGVMPIAASGEPKQLAALEARMAQLGRAPELVIVGIGGNDIQFSDIGVSCVLPGDCREFIEKLGNERLGAVGDELERTFAEIRDVVGTDVPVVAVPYPTPIHPDARCTGVVLSDGDVQVINTFTGKLNDEIEESATRTGVLYAGTIESGLSDSGRQLCDPDNASGLNFVDLNPRGGDFWTVVDPSKWGHNFVHPNEVGHAAIHAAAMRWFSQNPCVIDRTCSAAAASANLEELASQPISERVDVTDEYDDEVVWALFQALVFVGLCSFGWWLVITATIGWQGDGDDADDSVQISLLERIVSRIVGWDPTPGGAPAAGVPEAGGG